MPEEIKIALIGHDDRVKIEIMSQLLDTTHEIQVVNNTNDQANIFMSSPPVPIKDLATIDDTKLHGKITPAKHHNGKQLDIVKQRSRNKTARKARKRNR